MSAAIGAVFSATGAMLAWTAVAVWILVRPQSRAARRALVAATCAYLAASTYIVPAAVARVWNAGYHQFVPADLGATTDGPTALVVLGGGAETAVGWAGALSSLNAVATARVLEAIRVYRAIDPAWVISSGGRPDPTDVDTPAAFLMRDALVAAGVPSARIKVEAASRDTHDEAMLIAPLLKTLHASRIVLVTSDVHMRRSLGTFRAVGIDAVPAIAPDRGTSTGWRDWLLPSNHGLAFASQLAHELIGLPYYWMRGWWR